jgi:heme-degrading monooxygenase HmoA
MENRIYTATFIIKPKDYNDEFHVLNDRIDEIAINSPGYLYKEKWFSSDGRIENVVYYWDSLEAIHEFAKNEIHKTAKSRFAEWYHGYKVMISEVIQTRQQGDLD